MSKLTFQKRSLFAALFFLFSFFLPACHSTKSSLTTELFPEIEGWKKRGVPQVYSADTLFEYINGAAETYLEYGFQKLTSQHYEGIGQDQGKALAIDVYEHRDSNNGFGIYSLERPPRPKLLAIGAQGYRERGSLGFVKGPHYVKLTGTHLAKDEAPILENVARKVAGTLGGETHLPGILACFPGKGKIENSEKYIARNFLAHSFLHSAFTAEYKGEQELFLMVAQSSRGAEKMLEKYLELVRKKGMEFTEEKEMYRFSDPYYRSNGTLHLKRRGRYLWGLFSHDPSRAEYFVKEIENNLKKLHFIK